MKPFDKPLLLLDGNSLTYRAFFALPTDMATAGGQVTNAVFGFTSMLIYLIKEHQPGGIIATFDRPEPTFRHEAHEAYKANREAAPDILRQQMGLVRQVVDALGIVSVDLAGWEADDLIATLTTRAVGLGRDVVIVTGDRDSYQLVADPHVRVLYNRRGVSDYSLYDEAGILERTGVTPALYPQYAALRGDPSDNLPGVPGVGEKTAAKLITTYGGLDGIFANVDQQTPKLRENLTANEAQARTNHGLMVLRHDAPIDVDFDTVGITPDLDEVKRLFEFLEFRSLLDRLGEALVGLGVEAPRGSGNVLEAETTHAGDAAAAVAALRARPIRDIAAAWVGAPSRSPLLGLAVVTDPAAGEVCWIPAELLTDPAVAAEFALDVAVRTHDAKAVMRSLLDLGLPLIALSLDTAIAAYLIDPAETRYAIADLLLKYTGDRLPVDDPATAGKLDFGDSAVDDGLRTARAALGDQSARPGARIGARPSRDGRAVPPDREPARRRAGRDGARRCRCRPRRVARPQPTADRRNAPPRGGVGPRRRPPVQPQLADPTARDPLHRAWPGTVEEDQDRVLDRRRDAWRSCAINGRSSSIRCSPTARSRSCAVPTAKGCSPRSVPTSGSTRRSTRRSPAPVG